MPTEPLEPVELPPQRIEPPQPAADTGRQNAGPPAPFRLAPQPTGRRLVMFKEGFDSRDAAELLRSVSGGRPVVSASTMGALGASVRAASASDAIVVLERLGMAAIGGGLERTAALAGVLQARDEVEDTRPEFWMFALEGPPWADSGASTWGLEAIGAVGSGYDGSGISIAVLDTGLDLGHPDFLGRRIITESFVPGQTVDDVQGHGTHTAGTAASSGGGGGNLPRYGVAPGAELHIGKVLNNLGAGRELDIQAGIEWAMGECQVVSMSLGRPVAQNEAFDPIYETIAQRALAAGTLIVAAAGNESDRRYGYIAPVGSPANAPSIMAVAAVGADAGVATFSCGSVGVGSVTICAPGVGVLSSVPRPELYKRLQGTSMACPHVAGVAALWAQKTGARGQELWDAVVGAATPVGPGAPKRLRGRVGSGALRAYIRDDERVPFRADAVPDLGRGRLLARQGRG